VSVLHSFSTLTRLSSDFSDDKISHAFGMHEATDQVIHDKPNEIVSGTTSLEEAFFIRGPAKSLLIPLSFPAAHRPASLRVRRPFALLQQPSTSWLSACLPRFLLAPVPGLPSFRRKFPSHYVKCEFRMFLNI
jgi:hypothetical protein